MSKRLLSKSWQRYALAAATVATGGATFAAVGHASDWDWDVAFPGEHPWPHFYTFTGFDHASLRRGYQVYSEVCSACHSMNMVYYYQLIGVTHTKEEVEKLAARAMIVDEDPGERGQEVLRPGKLYDTLPGPYKNLEAAKFANGGSEPPDFSNAIRRQMEDGDVNFVFNLVLGYDYPVPEGVVVPPGKYWNPFFKGGIISMPPPLQDESVEYTDGTQNNKVQLAYDVTNFLAWASEPDTEARKRILFPLMCGFAFCIVTTTYWKRYAWNIWKTHKITWLTPKHRPVG